MSFQFRLQKVLDLKVKQKEQAEWVVADATKKQRDFEESVTKWMSQKESLQNDLDSRSNTKVSVGQLQNLNGYITHVNNVLYSETEKLNNATVKLEESRESLKSKYIEMKSWNLMRDKAHENFRAEFSRQEQRQIEEVAITQYMKQLVIK